MATHPSTYPGVHIVETPSGVHPIGWRNPDHRRRYANCTWSAMFARLFFQTTFNWEQ